MTILFLTSESSGQASGHIQSGLSAWALHMVTLIFLGGLCGYVWVNHSLYHPRGADYIDTCMQDT